MKSACTVIFSYFLAAEMLFCPIRAAVASTGEPVKVMVVGSFHMSNPGHDLHNSTVDDVLVPKRQAEIAAVIDGIVKFAPNKVMAEWPAEIVAERYQQYLSGVLPPSRNEVVQLGFRLAKTAHSEGIFGIDVDGDFPFEPVKIFAKGHDLQPLLDNLESEVESGSRALAQMMGTRSIGAVLRYLNEPDRVNESNNFYSQMLRFGAGDQQPGAELLAAWNKRNIQICANLVQRSNPGDRIVVFYGAGHAFLLRRCVRDVPGFELVEPNGFLPK